MKVVRQIRWCVTAVAVAQKTSATTNKQPGSLSPGNTINIYTNVSFVYVCVCMIKDAWLCV